MTGTGAFGMTDHEGSRLTHGRPTVNGVGIHYATGGSGEPVFLLHGVPKTMYHWHRVIPLLTRHHTVVAMDIRGFGDSERPSGGYDTRTMADDVAALATHLGHDRFRVVGEDWGAAIAYAVAAFHRPRVEQLVYQETRLPGLPVPDIGPLKADDPRNGWHRAFFDVPHFPELLLAGRERPFWSSFMRRIMWDPSAYTDADVDENVRWVEQPGATRAIMEVYRATETDAAQNRTQFPDPLTCPVLAVGGRAYLGDEPRQQMVQVASDVRGVVVERAGHNIALEAPHELARVYLGFFAGR
jgi:pimeloyl-ACP methyl ester carboxylesterase